MDIGMAGVTRESRSISTDSHYLDTASTKTYNEVDCIQQLLYIEIEKGEYGGYRQHLLANRLSQVEVDFYTCTKCNGLLRNACLVGTDQNLACETCVVEREISQPMIKSRKKIPELGAKCPLVSRGCVWKGNIGEVDVHLDECNELIIKCLNGCKVILKRSELINHCENECINRKVNCIHCKAVMLYKEIDNHFTTCRELPLLCLNECLQTIPRKEMTSHIENNCPNTLIDCPNECGLKLKRIIISDHCENECQLRTVICEYCGVTLQCKELENHHKSCREFPLVCPNQCLECFIRREMELHLEKECPNTLVFCANGCESKFKRSELLVHCEKECQHRNVNCIHCKAVMLYKEIDDHFTTCLELPLLCLNECMETFPRKEMASHIENNCPNTLVHCINECGLKMKRSKLSIHCENECQHRTVICDYCGTTLRYIELENHHNACLEFPLVCPNECQRRMRKELESHIEEECPKTLIACPYKEMGCDVLPNDVKYSNTRKISNLIT